MKYIINLSIVFDVNARALTLKNDHHLSIELSKPATRLLCELIINNNTTLIREDIIRTVWTDYGFTPSEASLSNHISELRKSFENLGLGKEIIVTVPRAGFRLEADIHPVVVSEDNSEEIVPEPPEVVTQTEQLAEMNTPMTMVSDTATGITKLKIGLLALGILVVSVAAVFTFIFSPKNNSLHVIFNKEKCSIYNLSNKIPTADFIVNATEMMSSEGIDCKREAKDIYYVKARQSSKFQVNFMAVCSPGESLAYQNCINYKIIK